MGTMLPFNALAIGTIAGGGTGGGGTYSGPTVVAVSYATNSSGSTLSIPVPSGTQTGQLVILGVTVEWSGANAYVVTDSTMTPPSGFTYVGAYTRWGVNSGGWQETVAYYYGYSTLTSGSWTFTANTAAGGTPGMKSGGAILIGNGPTVGNPFLGAFGFVDTTSPGTVPSLTPSLANSLLLATIYDANTIAGTVFSAPTGWTIESGASGGFSTIADYGDPNTAATGGLTFASSNGGVIALVGAIAPALPSGASQGDPVVSNLAGQLGSGYANGTGYAAKFNNPNSIALDLSGNIYVADSVNNDIRKVTQAGVVTLLSGSTSQASGYTNGNSTTSRYNVPGGVAVDSSGNLYVTDTNNYRIRKVTSAGASSLLAGNGTNGHVDGNSTAAEFTGAYVPGLDWAGNLIVGEYSYIRSVVLSSGATSTLAGTGSTGFTNGPAASAQFNAIGGTRVDLSGNIYVADYNNNAIRKLSYDHTTVSTVAGVSSGTAGYTDGPALTAQFNGPGDLALDPLGNIYVADQNNNVIRKITPSGTVSTYAGYTDPNDVFYNGTAPNSLFKTPLGITIDAAQNIYVSDANSSVRKIAPAVPVGSFPAPAFVASTSASDVTGSATSLTGTLPANSSGYIAYFMPAANGGFYTTNVIAPAGWTQIYARAYDGNPTTSDVLYIYVSTSPTPGTTWSWTGSSYAGLMIDGYDHPITLANAGVAYNASVAPAIAASPSTTVVRAYLDENIATSTVTITYPSGTSNQHANTVLISGTGTMILASASAASPSSYGTTSTATYSVSAGSSTPQSFTLALASTGPAYTAPIPAIVTSYYSDAGTGASITVGSGVAQVGDVVVAFIARNDQDPTTTSEFVYPSGLTLTQLGSTQWNSWQGSAAFTSGALTSTEVTAVNNGVFHLNSDDNQIIYVVIVRGATPATTAISSTGTRTGSTYPIPSYTAPASGLTLIYSWVSASRGDIVQLPSPWTQLSAHPDAGGEIVTSAVGYQTGASVASSTAQTSSTGGENFYGTLAVIMGPKS